MWQLLKQYFMPEYTSEIDQFLQHFDDTHSNSASQQKELEKYRCLYKLRDNEKQE